MQEVHLKAMAKINLGLDVLRRREDGYHEVEMIMQTVNLYDKVHIKRTTEPGIRLETNLYFLPTNETNLAYKAAKLLMDEFDIKDGVDISIKKFIPVSAGLAGGSTDGGAVLYGMNQLFHLKLTRKQLMERGILLGADVPYCLMRGTALAQGIGEKLTRLPSLTQRLVVLLAKPGINVSTKFVYSNLKLDEVKHPDIDAQIQAIKENNTNKMIENMGNVLESVTIPAYPVIDEIKRCMMENGALGAMMSGSGPTVFGIFSNKKDAINAQEIIRERQMAKLVYVTNFFNV